jgi:hypothetical protein
VKRYALISLFGCMVASWPLFAHGQQPRTATAQSCDSLAGPARTDCYIALSRISGGESEIAAGTARLARDRARLHRATGERPEAQTRRIKRKHQTGDGRRH